MGLNLALDQNMSPKGSPSVFSILQQVPSFTFFGTMRLTGDFKKISKTLSDTVEEST